MVRNYMILAGYLLLPLLFCFVDLTISSKIYDNLIHCYRDNATEPWVGNSFKILLELIRKVEEANPTSIDIRVLSANIFHQLRLDGIQRSRELPEQSYAIPYAPRGIMVPKFKLLLDVISKTTGKINFEEFLSPAEICALHRMVSSTVEPRTRGDESRICPDLLGQETKQDDSWFPRNTVKVFPDGSYSVIPGEISRCPIEGGVVRTETYGTLTPGTVIGSIAAGLQPQMVPLKELIPYELKIDPFENLESMDRRDTEAKVRKLMRSTDALDNAVVAGLAGDLAEVCVRQGPNYRANVSVGLSGFWNDTFFPRAYYLKSHDLWEMTDSEILAGIDGIHLSRYIVMWTNRIRRLRLSQVLEMYYSPRGVPTFAIEKSLTEKDEAKDDEVADDEAMLDENEYPYVQSISSMRGHLNKDLKLNRDRLDRYLLGEKSDRACERERVLDRLSRIHLKDQTYFVAQILQFSIPGPPISDELLKKSCIAAVDKFFIRAQRIIDSLPKCENITTNYRSPKIDMTLILDGSRSKYESWRLISTLAELMDVSIFGSKLSVVHGSTGEYLVSRTNSVTTAFEQLRDYAGLYPFSLSLSRSLARILTVLTDQDYQERRNGVIGGVSRVIFVVCQMERLKQDDFDDSKRMLEGSFRQFPDLHFVFLTHDRVTFEELTSNVASKDAESQYTIIESSDLDPKGFATTAMRTLRRIPKRLRVPSCDVLSLEDTNTNISQIKRIEYEDYVSPNQAITYYLRGPHQSDVRVKFQGMGYGDISICQGKTHNAYHCLGVEDFGEVIFNVSTSCDTQDQSCFTSLFTVNLESSYMKCTENDCQYPDQIRYLIRIDNLECTKDNANLRPSISPIVLIFVPIQILIIKFLF